MVSSTRQKGQSRQRTTDRQRKSKTAGKTGTRHPSSNATDRLADRVDKAGADNASDNASGKLNTSFSKAGSGLLNSGEEQTGTPIQRCVHNELRRYFNMLDGEEPSHLYRMVIQQAENALLESVMQECRGNQTRAALWLGISRGNLRSKLADMDKK